MDCGALHFGSPANFPAPSEVFGPCTPFRRRHRIHTSRPNTFSLNRRGVDSHVLQPTQQIQRISTQHALSIPAFQDQEARPATLTSAENQTSRDVADGLAELGADTGISTSITEQAIQFGRMIHCARSPASASDNEQRAPEVVSDRCRRGNFDVVEGRRERRRRFERVEINPRERRAGLRRV